MILEAIDKAFRRTKSKGWEYSYWAFDIHETILKPNWKVEVLPTEFYSYAKETLKLVSDRKDIKMILYTCSRPEEIEKYLTLFEANGIHFDFVNKNPDVVNEGFGFYDDKPYFNVLFEDKAGFNAKQDWKPVYDLLTNEH